MFPSRTSAALAAAVASLVAVPLAHGATLSVDDDGADCPAAPYHSVQAAVTAAAAGDTVAICPGTYVEGTGGIASNALTITKSLTVKGAGADLVTIKPKNAGGQIAEGGTPAIRNGVGDIVVARGFPETPITVNLSGVTIDGAGVASEAGVLYLDAQGSVVRSRVTNVVTSEGDAASSQIGGYRSTMPGYGIAQVTAAGTAPATAAPRPLLVDHTRVDKYNRIGILIDGATATSDTATLTSSGVVNQLTMLGSEVIGRTLCINYVATGNCSSVGLLTTGTLYGQDGVRVTGGSTATVTSSMVSQNLVNGDGAPARGAAYSPNLTKGAGFRFVNAGPSSITKTNIVDNAYGVLNVLANQTAANTATKVDALNNWWGLGYAKSTNPGPAISPTTNPVVPENPVNGDGAGVSAVNFTPFRDGPQANPITGEFALLGAPTPAADLPPTVELKASPAFGYYPGGTITLDVASNDDFGVKHLVVYEGTTVLKDTITGPFGGKIVIPVPADTDCADHTYSAVVEDSLGQTSATAPVTITGICNTPEPGDTPAAGGSTSGGGGSSSPSTDGDGGSTTSTAGSTQPPTITVPQAPQRIAAGGSKVTATPVADAGVAHVDYYLGTRLVCTVASAPYTCDIEPTGSDVGTQTLRVVVTDNAGSTAETSSSVTIAKFAPSGLTLKVKSKKAGKGLAKRTISGKLVLPAHVTAAQACASGRVTVVVKRGGSTFDNTQVKLDATCGFSRSFTARKKGKPFSVSAKFAGNTVLAPISNSRRFS